MQLVRPPDTIRVRMRFPAPLCRACNEPMVAKGVNANAIPCNEYHCVFCGSGIVVRRRQRVV